MNVAQSRKKYGIFGFCVRAEFSQLRFLLFRTLWIKVSGKKAELPEPITDFNILSLACLK